jgi:hypothetical protein
LAQDVQLPVQGMLADADGTPIDGEIEMAFAIYADAKADEAAWSETVTVDVDSGLFTVYLGTSAPLSATVLRDAAAPEFSMTIVDDVESLGRWPLGSAPLAAYAALAGDAQTLQGKKPEELVAAGSIASEHIADGTVEAEDLKQTYAGSVIAGGPALTSQDLACTACVSESEVSFSWAAATAPGGAANSSDDLTCTACVSPSELTFDPAEQSELDTHKTGGDHDTRYVDTSGDTMTGVLSLATDGLSCGTDQLVLSGGKVGVGTALPQAPLHVEGMLVEGATQGTISHSVASYFTNQSTTDYIHIRTPFNPTMASDMFHFKVTGYAYGASPKVIDITYVGYAYMSSGTLKNTEIFNPNAGHAPMMYQGSDDNVYLRFKPSNTYYMSFRVDSMYVGNGRIVEPGEVTITRSAASML